MATSRRTATTENVSTFGDTGFGRDYTVPATWVTDTDLNLVTATQSEVLECYTDAASYDLQFALVNATTSIDYHRIVRPAAGQGHDGTPDTGVTFTSAATNPVIKITESFSNLQDLVVKCIVNSSFDKNAITYTGGGATLGCVGVLMTGTNAGSGTAGGLKAFSSTRIIVNCLAYTGDDYGFSMQGGTVYNCTAIDNVATGILRPSGAALTATNCLSKGSGTSDFSGVNTSTYNASSDTSATGTGSRTSQTFTFVNAASDDYHLDAADAGAKDFGTDLSADGTFAFDDDIDGETITTWSMGFDAIVAAGGYSLTVSPGTYTLTGSTATLRADRTLTLAPSSYALSGAAAGLRAARTLTLAPTSYTLTGVAALLSRGYLLTLAPTSYTLTGSAAGLRVDRTLSLAPTSYATDGSAAALRTARMVNLAPTSYGLTGNAAALTRGYLLVLSPDSYTMTGAGTTLRADRVVLLNAGSYVLSGANTTLIYHPLTGATYTLDLGPGSYLVTGAGAGLRRGYLLTLTPSTYALTGSVATVRTDRTVTLAPASYDMTGYATTLVRGYLLTLAPSSYVMSGTDADLRVDRTLTLAPGSYGMTGDALTVAAHRVLALGPGSYLLSGDDAALLAARILTLSPGSYLVTGAAATLTQPALLTHIVSGKGTVATRRDTTANVLFRDTRNQ